MTAPRHHLLRRLRHAGGLVVLAARLTLLTLGERGRRWPALAAVAVLGGGGAMLASLAGAPPLLAVPCGWALTVLALVVTGLASLGELRRVATYRALRRTFPLAQVVAVTPDPEGDRVEVVIAGADAQVTFLDADCRPQRSTTQGGTYRQPFWLDAVISPAAETARREAHTGHVVEYYTTAGPFSPAHLQSAVLAFPEFTVTLTAAGAAPPH